MGILYIRIFSICGKYCGKDLKGPGGTMKKYLLGFLLSFSVAYCAQLEQEPSLIESIGQYVKQTVMESDSQPYELMVRHLQQLQLLDENKKWRDSRLEDISDNLLPQNIDVKLVTGFIDEATACAVENPYLKSAIAETKFHDLADLFQTIESEGSRVLPDVIAYGMVLQNLTKAIYKDINILKACNDIWVNALKDVSWFQYFKCFSPFELAKYYTIFGLYGVIRDCEKGHTSPDRFRYGVPFNILEASLSDLFHGHWGNAKAGWALMTNPAGGNKDPDLGTGPTYVTDNEAGGKSIHTFHPLPTDWANLYTAWNLGFVANYNNFPYFMTKLLIPQVNGFQDLPEEYLFNRIIALWVHANSELFGRIHNKPTINWYNKGLVNAFNIANKHSAQDYQAKITSLSSKMMLSRL